MQPGEITYHIKFCKKEDSRAVVRNVAESDLNMGVGLPGPVVFLALPACMRVCETVGRLSIRLSHRSTAAGLLLSAVQVGDIDRQV